ncbi:glutaredoxin [Billgrantia endophytica]|uniref:Methylamine utilization protein MauE n=1 Tax=Billgrantia endophytica TaxID=2033802 RepID=A0A2N7U7P4_9GAMM|nr:glutaredoxin [Halomonas endophytica]PMR76439.1 glutaredoxin [Halomonas endophytica]
MGEQQGNVIYHKRGCGWSDKAIGLLEKHDVSFEDHEFASKTEEEEFKAQHGVGTTPQVYLNGEHIGGYDALAEHFGEQDDEEESATSYVPVIAVFSTTALLALATQAGIMGFMGFSLAVLACLKLMDIPGFVQGFRQYDLITRRVPAYGRVYPFAELFVGLGFLSGLLPLVTGLVAILVGIAGGFSIIKAVYVDKADLNCACVGGNSNVPLGVISFTENAMMAGMGLWVLLRLM